MDSLRVVSLPPAYCLYVIAPASFSLLGCVCCANLKAPLTGPLRIPRATEYWKTAAYLPAEPLWLCELTPSQFAARHSVPEQSWFAFQWPWLPTTRFSRDGAAQLHITLAVDRANQRRVIPRSVIAVELHSERRAHRVESCTRSWPRSSINSPRGRVGDGTRTVNRHEPCGGATRLRRRASIGRRCVWIGVCGNCWCVRLFGRHTRNAALAPYIKAPRQAPLDAYLPDRGPSAHTAHTLRTHQTAPYTPLHPASSCYYRILVRLGS